MCQEGGAEAESGGGGRDEEDYGEGLPGLRKAARIGNTIQILGADNEGFV